MALTIGVRTYTSNADLRELCADPQFAEALRAELSRHGNEGQRQEAMANAKAKLKKWVTHDAKYGIQYGRRGQDKSFPSREAAVKWLVYKQRKTFAANQQTESRLAEEVHTNAAIRRQLFEFLREHLEPWWARQPRDVRSMVGSDKGRYAHFYSKILSRRTIAEGFQYFSTASGGALSKTVTERNLSISELAAFLADVALTAKKPLSIKGRHTAGVDNLRVNPVVLEQETRKALDTLFEKVNVYFNSFDAGRKERLLQSLDLVLAYTPAQLQQRLTVGALVTVFGEIVGFLECPAEIRGAFPVGVPESAGQSLLEKFAQNSTVSPQYLQGMLRKYRSGIRKCVNLPRTGAAEAAQLLRSLEAEMAADVNRVPASLQERNEHLFTAARMAGRENYKRMEYNVDVDHQWTQFMISQNAVIGAGPSSTTSITLALTELAAAGASSATRALYEYAVAMALFSFWQRKKTALRMKAAVHTWNEVCAALDHHRGANPTRRSRDGFLQVRATGADVDGVADSGFHIYEYPAGFNDDDGRPDFGRGRGVISFETLLAD